MANEITRSLIEYWWNRSLSCAEALFTILNRAAGEELVPEEQAAHVLAGGILNQGHACGMLWGSALAAGVRARARLEKSEVAGSAALRLTALLMDEFPRLTGAMDCREIIGQNLNRVSGKVGYLTSGGFRDCTRYALKWAPQAQAVIQAGLANFDPASVGPAPKNCAMETMSRLAGPLGLEPEQAPVWVAGFAGGLGLKGNGCGAYAAGLFALALRYYRRPERKARDSLIKTLAQEVGLARGFALAPSRLRAEFISRFGSELCRELTGARFASAEDHSAFLAEGGCREPIEFITAWIKDLPA